MVLSLVISESKGNKSGNLNDTLKILVSVFGGKSALEKKSPICAGRYNSTKANEASMENEAELQSDFSLIFFSFVFVIDKVFRVPGFF